MAYRIYIDEVGNPDLESSDNPNHRFLSLTGVIVDLQYVKDFLHPQMEELKSTFFNSHPDEPVILHETFCGTGTRNLSDEGKKAIEDLFSRSFAV